MTGKSKTVLMNETSRRSEFLRSLEPLSREAFATLEFDFDPHRYAIKKTHMEALCSIALSLKRIADLLERRGP
jgi:hypothetical protein